MKSKLCLVVPTLLQQYVAALQVRCRAGQVVGSSQIIRIDPSKANILVPFYFRIIRFENTRVLLPRYHWTYSIQPILHFLNDVPLQWWLWWSALGIFCVIFRLHNTFRWNYDYSRFKWTRNNTYLKLYVLCLRQPYCGRALLSEILYRHAHDACYKLHLMFIVLPSNLIGSGRA